MVKSNVNISVDSELIKLSRTRDLNLSGVINEFLRNYLEVGELKVSEIARVEKEVSEMEIQLNALKTHLEVLKKQEESEKEKAKQELTPVKEFHS